MKTFQEFLTEAKHTNTVSMGGLRKNLTDKEVDKVLKDQKLYKVISFNYDNKTGKLDIQYSRIDNKVSSDLELDDINRIKKILS